MAVTCTPAQRTMLTSSGVCGGRWELRYCHPLPVPVPAPSGRAGRAERAHRLPVRPGEGRAWAREFFAETQPFASGGAYINFLTQDESDRIAFAYGATYNRLVELKKKYDPTNIFRMNQNIKPV